ncbi:MAG TPA: tRNA (adenine-N1)-methyltransferase [Thermoplasmata archaeon]|nr:tRNA (adenine-N1)-methyltransferase [Thermoplasmata archaeon]
MLLRRSDRDAFLLRLSEGPQVVEGRGVVDLSSSIGHPAGGQVVWAGAPYRILRPSLSDRLQHLRRKAQIITPKDAQYLLYLADIGPGSQVVEAGSGSGALTVVVAHAVGESGHVISFDRRPEFLEVARKNVGSAGYEGRVEFRERDVAESGLDATDVDAVVLDLPEPWTVLESARSALRFGGTVASYVPTYNQLERTVQTMRALGFEELRSLELLERELHVGSGGTRPEFEMLGHTGFLASGRKV